MEYYEAVKKFGRDYSDGLGFGWSIMGVVVGRGEEVFLWRVFFMKGYFHLWMYKYGRRINQTVLPNSVSSLNQKNPKNPPGRYPNAWMASTAKHPVMERVTRRLPQTAKVGEVLQATGPDFLTQVIKENQFKATKIIKMEDVYVQ